MHRYFGFAIATLQLFQHPENVKISIFPFTLSGRNPVSPEIFNEFSKTFFWLKEEERGYCDSKFEVHRYFGFAIATLQLFQHPENVKFQFFPFRCPSRNAVSPEIFNEFSKTFFGWKKKKVYIVFKNFKCTDILDFQTATLKLFQNPENVKISISPFTLSQ